MAGRRVALALLALAPWLAAPFAAPFDRLVEPAREPRAPSVAAQLARAEERAARARETDGRAGLAARLRAIEAWRAVRREHPDARAAARRAAGEEARALSALGLLREAVVAREAALALADDPRERATLRLEFAHALRRAERPDAAIEAYAAVVAAAAAGAAERDAASLWWARLQREAGDAAAARATWRRLADAAADDAARVEAYDRLALDALDAGDRAGAAGWIDRARRALGPASDALTPRGERLRRALHAMRAPVELAVRRPARVVEDA